MTGHAIPAAPAGAAQLHGAAIFLQLLWYTSFELHRMSSFKSCITSQVSTLMYPCHLSWKDIYISKITSSLVSHQANPSPTYTSRKNGTYSKRPESKVLQPSKIQRRKVRPRNSQLRKVRNTKGKDNVRN
jgi:hypothetical protein